MKRFTKLLIRTVHTEYEIQKKHEITATRRGDAMSVVVLLFLL